MGDVRQVALGEVADVTVGFVGSMAGEYVDVGVPFLRSLNVRPYRIDPADLKYVGSAFHRRLSKSELSPGDVVMVRTGKPGQAAVIPEWLGHANCSDLVVIRPSSSVNAHWLVYYLNGMARHAIAGGLVGAVQQHFNVKSTKEMQLPLPERSAQDAIAGILGTLDDKIAVNDQTIELTLSYTDALFKRAAAHVSRDSVTFGTVADVGGGGTPKTIVEDFWGGDVAWATPTDVTGLAAPYLSATARTITPEGLRACSSPLYPSGSILMTSRATIGAFAIAQIPTAVNQGFIVVNAKEPEYQWWLFHEMASRVDDFLSYANGATFLELPRKRFRDLSLRWPTSTAAKEFAEQVAPLHELGARMVEENCTLARTRDQLLPLLMSGKVTVKDAEDEVSGMV
ncbi:hypothetical protein GIY30_09265 [Gordonia sp. HNM0687]|uniref:Type I restriction modification DNA specificity domain-containing protein n=1 Tax=Gordonia mangrovi TaxID=2665643 RepID=A0A6L7GNN8_9ACTN|nr:restriction endonuclease subunit S [Gordonia mangrovi]MXP21539.1 hypothetical protein [Gordonia mangrovi]UVF80282.1 restriction endonuclease subunit S [Gordonia mangrovi]